VSGLTIGPCFCSTGGNKGIADDIGIRLARRRGVGRGEEDTGSSVHMPLDISESTIAASAAVTTPLVLISGSGTVVDAFYNIKKRIKLKLFIHLLLVH
jgi:hypothetical protein